MAKLLREFLKKTLRLIANYVIIGLLAPQALGQAEDMHTLKVDSGTAQLLVIQQIGRDALIEILGPGETRRYFDNHIGRTGPEIILLDAGEYQIILRNTTKSHYIIEHYPMDPDSATAIAARHLTAAGSAPKSLSYAGLQQTLSRYEQVDSGDAQNSLSAFAHFMRAVVLYQMGSYDQALKVLDKTPAVALLNEFSYQRRWLRAEILFAQDLYAQSQVEFEQALVELTSSISTEGKTPGEISLKRLTLDLADIKINLGLSRILTGDAEGGKVELDEGFALAEKENDRTIIGRAHNNFATYFHFKQNSEAAAEHLKIAIGYLQNSTDPKTLIYALSNLSTTYRNLGQYQLARETAHLVLSQAEANGNPTYLAAAYTGLASLYLTMGEFKIAEEYARLSRAIDIDIERTWRSNTLLNMEADALLSQHRPIEAINRYLKTTAYFNEHGPSIRHLSNLLRLVRAYIDANQLDAASSEMAQAQTILASNPNLATQTITDAVIELDAKILIQQQQFQRAIKKLEQAFDADINHLQPRHVVLADLLMQAHFSLQQFDIAANYGERATLYVREIRQQLDYTRLGPAWSKTTHPVFLRTIDSLLSQYEATGDLVFAQKAFLMAEQARAFNLARQREASLFASPTQSMRSAELSSQLSQLARKRASLSYAKNNHKADLDYFRMLEQYQASLALDKNVAVKNNPISVESLQRLLTNNQALIQFICVPASSCYRFHVTQKNFGVERVGSYEDINIYAQAMQNELRQRTVTEITAASKMSATLLGGGLLKRIGGEITELMFINSYPINTIPLSVLSVGDSPQAKALVNRYSITYLPNAGALKPETRPAREFSYDLAVLADPDFDPSANEFSPSAKPHYLKDRQRSWYGNLERLPWSAREAKNLVEHFAGKRIRTMTGSAANKQNLLDEFTRNSRILHIASHGYFNENTPDLVGIATSPQKNDSGFITLEELLMYPFHTELVVISGCETGLGENRGGEGMISLSRAFLGQGANHVIATQWPVSDRASAQFMKLFYAALDTNTMNVAAALQTAQIQLAQQPEYRAPFYWAPYILTSVRN